jgi:AcrR family transcriptional regulator
MKRIKQIEESKKMIADALMRLLKSSSLEEISISQIAAEAKIGRNTFYNHFQKKKDILQYLMEKFLTDARKSILQDGQLTKREFLLWRFSLIKNNPQFLIFQEEPDIRLMLLEFREYNESNFQLSKDTDEYEKEFFLGGLDYVTSMWIKKGMKESPEEMVKKLMSFIQ